MTDRLREVEELMGTFLKAMNLSLVPTLSEDEDSIRVELDGADSFLMLERRGSVLDALQLLVGKVAESRLGLKKRLVVDCQGFRQGREQELVQNALRVAEKVRALGQPMELAPMNSYERRLIHLALAEEQGVTSRSDGDGFTKRIIISPA